MNKWYIVGGIGVVIAGVLLFLISSKDTFEDIDLSKGPIVAFGDSLIYGIGAPKGEGFTDQLSKKIGHPIINLGIPGNTTKDGMDRLDTVLALNPSLVILLFGGNDYLKRVPMEETFTNLDRMISELKTRNIDVVLLGIQGGVVSDPFEKEFSALAKKHDIAYVSNVLGGLIGKQSLMSDAVHPNTLGYTKITERVYDVVSKFIPES